MIKKTVKKQFLKSWTVENRFDAQRTTLPILDVIFVSQLNRTKKCNDV
jgi:hypothetical protein